MALSYSTAWVSCTVLWEICLFFWAFIYFSECFLLLLLPVGSQKVNVILVTLGRQCDRRRFCRVFWRQSRHATSVLWGSGCSIPAAGNTWLLALLLLEQCHLPCPAGRQLSRQLMGQNSVCSIGETDLVVVMMFSLISQSINGWEPCMCVRVWGGLEQDLDVLTDVENQRSRTRATDMVSELALDGNTWGHSKKRCAFLLFKRNNPHPLHASNDLWSTDWRRNLGFELGFVGPSRSWACRKAGACPVVGGWSPYWSTWRVGPNTALRGYN